MAYPIRLDYYKAQAAKFDHTAMGQSLNDLIQAIEARDKVICDLIAQYHELQQEQGQ